MFGEYAQVASYMQPAQVAAYKSDAFNKQLPSYLSPVFHPPQPWNQEKAKSRLGEDFIMIAEFSELEGPKPLMTIPKDGGANFDQNSFAVRILAVDHLNPTAGFSISEDAQIVVTDAEAGVFAFVHHMVLYDNTARGFVRPYCIAFITAEQRKLMFFYEELSWKFKKVARFLKYGNKMVFVGDLERHLKDLEYTKNVLLNQVCNIRLRSSEGTEDRTTDARKNADNELYKGLETIRQSSSEIKEILSVLKPLLPDRRLEARFRILEDRAYQGYSSVGLDKLSLPESGFADFFSGMDELDFRYGSLTEPRISPLALFKPREYKPVLVATKKAKRFNAPLRGLHELCSWGAKEGLRKLRHIHMYFKRDMAVLELHKNESRLFRPRYSTIYHGQCITGNFLSGVQMKNSLEATEEAEQNWSLLYTPQWGSLGSLESEDSFKSFDPFPPGSDHYEASPTSFYTYDSMSYNVFQSASASPEKEFSLLMSNEYYPDLKTSQEEEMTYTESKVSRDIFQNEKMAETSDVDRTLLVTNDEFSAKHLRASSWNGSGLSEKVKVCDANISSSLQVQGQILSNENDLLQRDTISGSDHESSHMILDTTVSGMNDNHFINKEIMLGNERSKYSSKSEVLSMNREFPRIKDELTYKINGLNTENGNNILQDQDDSLADMALQNSRDLPICEDKHLIICNNQDGRSVNTCSLPLAADTICSVESVDENTDNSISLNATKIISQSLGCSSEENILSRDKHDDVQVEGSKKILPRNLQLVSEDCPSSAENNHMPDVVHGEHIVVASKSNCYDSLLSPKFEKEQNLNREVSILLGSSFVVNELPKNGYEVSPQRGSENTQNDSDNSSTGTQIPQNGSKNVLNGSENFLSGSEFPLQNGTGNSHNASEVVQNDLTICQNISELSMNDSERSLKDTERPQKDTERPQKDTERPQNHTESSQNISEIQQNGSEILQESVTSLQRSPDESSSKEKPENKLPPETNGQGQVASQGYKKITTSSKLSHSLLLDYHHFDHHITRVTHLRGEKGNRPVLNNDDDVTRPRTESDASSVFTEISLQDLYPRLNNNETESKDGALYEGREAAVVKNEPKNIVTAQSISVWKPRCNAFTVGDWINNLSQARPGFGLSEVLLTYQCLDHVIFSLLCGRPVLVAGPIKMESEVIKIVNALAVFVPVSKRKCQTVLEWTSKPLKITDLIKLKLIGVCRPERKSLDSFVPGAIKKACTVVDIEKRTIVAPPYQGQFIPALMSKKNVLRSDVQLLSYAQWWFMGILAKAYIFFHSFCQSSEGSVLYSQSPKEQRDVYHVTVSRIMSRLGVKDCDCDIVENLTEMIKLTKIESGFWPSIDSGCSVCPLTLQHKTCEKFPC